MSTRIVLMSAVLWGTLGMTLSVAPAAEPDLLDDVQGRMKIEAQRLEKEFADGRTAAYRLVRSDEPRLVEASEKLQVLLALLRNDTSLEPRRRDLLLVTLRHDLDRIKEIAGERRQAAARRTEAALAASRPAASRPEEKEAARAARGVGDEARAIIESRSKTLADSRFDRRRSGDGFNKAMRSVDESALPEVGDYRFPKDWVEKSKRRSAGVKMTAQERAIMKALSTTIDVDFNKNTFEEVIDYLRKSLKLDIAIDKRALEEAQVSYESQVTLKLRATSRTVLKRILADLNLAYVIKGEAVQVTSRERAAQMTTTRAYYIGDLAPVMDLNYPPVFTQLAMAEMVNRIIAMITQQVDPQSWQVNNPDAAGAIFFDPITMSLVVKQTAEVHFLLGGAR